jgi:CzcA family heavy metal efflux pump
VAKRWATKNDARMLRAIVRFCLLHPWLVLGAAAILMALGIATVERAKYDVFPEFVPAQATIQTEAPGLVAEQVEALVTRPLENAINGANGVESVRSESAQGLSVINIAFREGSDPYRARQVIAEAVGEAATKLPTIAAAPRLSPLTSSTMDLLKVGFVSDKLDPAALRDLVQWTIRPRLLATPGVARAIVFGGAQRRIEVRVRPTALIASGASMGDVSNAIAALASVRGGGFAETANQRILVEPVAGAATIETLAAAPVITGSGAALTIQAVADVVDVPSPEFGDALIMGRPGVLVAMSSQYGANTLNATRAVEATLADLRPTLVARGIKLYPELHRPANFIEAALSGIAIDLMIGAVMIAFVLLVFLRNVRIAVIAFLSIPLSLLTALIVLDQLGFTINTMTLGGLAVALGVVVDDAIVDIENIVRRLRENDAADRIAIIEAAAVEVRAPVVYATYVLAFTIAPILFLTGLQGSFFAPLALAFLVAVLASLAVAMTVTPALAAVLLSRIGPVAESSLLDRIKAVHSRWLAPLFDRAGGVVVATVIVAMIGVVAFMSFGSELLPQFRERHYVVQATGPSGASISWMRDVGGRISRDLMAIPGVATVEEQIGRAEAGEDTFGPNKSEFHIELNQQGGANEDIVLEKIRAVMASYPGFQSETLTFLGDRISESLSGETAKVAINIYGSDLDALDASAADIAAALAKVPGAADVQVKAPPGTPVLRIALDSARMGLRGVTPTDAYDAIEATFQGRVVAQVPAADRITDIAVTLPPELRRDPESVADVLVRAADGATVRLGDIATIRLTEGRALISREGGQRRQIVTANPTGADVAGFVAGARAVIAKQVKLPPGVSLSFGGVAEGQKAASRQIGLNVAVAAIAIVALLILAFGGGRAAGLILAGTPFALAGGVIAVALTGGVLSLGALVGFVTLFGIAARNAILLVSHVDHLVEAEGAPWGIDTVMRAARERVTPILITALVTALGLAPLAFEAGRAGREVQGPMAIVILGGLVTSTLMSLILLPALIMRFRNAPLAD